MVKRGLLVSDRDVLPADLYFDENNQIIDRRLRREQLKDKIIGIVVLTLKMFTPLKSICMKYLIILLLLGIVGCVRSTSDSFRVGRHRSRCAG